jgi:hypothetical protein
MEFQVTPRTASRAGLTHEGALPTITRIDLAPQRTRNVPTIELARFAPRQRSFHFAGMIHWLALAALRRQSLSFSRPMKTAVRWTFRYELVVKFR